MNINIRQAQIFGTCDTIENPKLFTIATTLHIVFGALIYIYNLYFFRKISLFNSFLILLVLHTIYEMKDLRYFLTKDERYFETDDKRYKNHNSLINSLGDTIGSITGFVILSKFVNRKNCSMNKVLMITLTQVFLSYVVYTNKID